MYLESVPTIVQRSFCCVHILCVVFTELCMEHAPDKAALTQNPKTVDSLSAAFLQNI